MKITQSYDLLYEEYVINNLSLKEMSKKYSISESTLSKALVRNKIKKDKTMNSIPKEVLYKEYIENNKTLDELVVEFNTPKHKIYEYIKQYDLKKSKDGIRKNREETLTKKYGVDNPMKVNEIKEKVKETMLNKYGVEYAAQSKEIYEKVKETNLKKYGCEYSFQNEEVKKKIKESTKRNSLEKYGVPHHTQKNIIKTVSADKVQIFNDDYLFKDFLLNNSGLTISQLSNIFGYSESAISYRLSELNLHDLVVLYPKHSREENDIKEILIELGCKNIILNDRKILNGKEIDIYLPDYKIGIEFNGSYWHSEDCVEHNKHIKKSLLGLNENIFIYHIFGYEWNNKKESIINQLKNLLNKNENKIYARKCEIKESTKKEKSAFLNKNHLQGNDKSSVCLGLYYNNELVSIMTFTKPRFNKKYDWELSRYCTKAGTTVIGGASKLFKHFVREYVNDEETILSYSDIAKTKGNLYETLGFKLDHISKPNYVWWKSDVDYKTRYQTQLKDEVKTMHQNGYYRIYDCGNKVWIYKK